MHAHELDVVVIGAGFGGVHALHHLRGQGWRTRLLEAGDGVGGTWFWNRYPGARCDVESLAYSYTFAEDLFREWDWSERYAAQPEIERYINWVVDKLDLRRDIELSTRVASAVFDEASATWNVRTTDGAEYRARFVVSAAGCLSASQTPDFPGLDSFGGEIHHTAQWPSEGVDLAGKRVGVIGTGSSGIQVIPIIAEQAAHLTVFQRTANFSVPSGRLSPDPEVAGERKENLAAWREEAYRAPRGIPIPVPTRSALEVSRADAFAELEKRWAIGGTFALMSAFTDIATSEEANAVVADFVRSKIREIVHDPDTAEQLCPKGYPIGARRLSVGTNYYETFNRPDVRLVDVGARPIRRFTPEGIDLDGGEIVGLDTVVLATGFDAVTGALTRINIRGRDGRALRDVWQEAGPRTCLGLQAAGFPNLFMINGPLSPSVLNNMLLGIETNVTWIADCLDHMRRNELSAVEPTPEAQAEWTAHVKEVADRTFYPRADSWYLGANIPGKPRVFMVYVGGWPNYVERCRAVTANGYEGFSFTPTLITSDWTGGGM